MQLIPTKFMARVENLPSKLSDGSALSDDDRIEIDTALSKWSQAKMKLFKEKLS